MTTNDQELANKLKLKFGTNPNNPNLAQLESIKKDIKALVSIGETPTESDWANIVKKHCREAGSYRYKGADNSDLITLLELATKN